MIKIAGLKKNVEGTICFVIFGILVVVSSYSLNLAKERAGADITKFVDPTKSQQRHLADTLEMRLREQRSFMGAIVTKPVSHYGFTVRRNIFAPLPPFRGIIIQPQDLVLVSIPTQLEGGEFVAKIQDRKTGKIYSVKEKEQIEKIFTVERIQPETVILRYAGRDILLKAPKKELSTEELQVISIPSLSPEGYYVAQIKNQRTGELYSVRELDIIDNTYLVKKVEPQRVVLGRKGMEDVTLTPPPAPVGPPKIHLAYTGIIEMETGPVAQVENTRTGKIYFVREGEEIEETFRVKKIERNKLILSREGEDDIVLNLGGGR